MCLQLGEGSTLGYDYFYNNCQISRVLIGQELWLMRVLSTKMTSNANAMQVMVYFFCSVRHVPLEFWTFYDVISLVYKNVDHGNLLVVPNFHPCQQRASSSIGESIQ